MFISNQVMHTSSNLKKLFVKECLTNRFSLDVGEPKPAGLNIKNDVEKGKFSCRVGSVITSPGVCIDGIEGEMAYGPAVVVDPEPLAESGDDAGFCFRPI